MYFNEIIPKNGLDLHNQLFWWGEGVGLFSNNNAIYSTKVLVLTHEILGKSQIALT